MKVVSAKQMAVIESQAYRNGSTEDQFMEAAGKGVAEWIDTFVKQKSLLKQVTFLCGKGNNAGDAYVAGSHLAKLGYTALAYQIPPLKDTSPLCKKNHKRFLDSGGRVLEINEVAEELKFLEGGVIIDALFGTGFHGTAREPYATVIKKANLADQPILAIDIPSGLNGNTGKVEGEAIKATETIFLGLPKTGFFLEDGWNFVGKLRAVDFGLPLPYIHEAQEDFQMLLPELVRPHLPNIVKSRHKYQAGFVVGLSGSPGMPGAALLSTKAALRGGAGIVKLLHPKGMEDELASSLYELIKVPYQDNEIDAIAHLINSASAAFIGPGLGVNPRTKKLVTNVLQHIQIPCVIDADALSIIAEHPMKLPPYALLTPHIAEMRRLLKRTDFKPGTREFLDACQNYTEEHRITLILKGGPTYIFHPHEIIRVNPFGDPGMATAGSGDVLTGLLSALLAQGCTPLQAAELGTYLHGVAGELAAEARTSYCMIAGDIIDNLPKAFKSTNLRFTIVSQKSVRSTSRS